MKGNLAHRGGSLSAGVNGVIAFENLEIIPAKLAGQCDTQY
jgi:hypothetical protein